jgi:hypothetical protein
MAARVRALQQDHFAQQRRLARAAAADQREDLGTAHLQVDFRMHHMLAEARRHLAQFDDHFGGRRCALHLRGPAR